MDCRTARLLCEFDRPANPELEADDAEALARHLADCPECAVWQRYERKADAALGRAMRAVPMPAGLQERLLAGLSPKSIPWHGRRSTRLVAALAAALLLMVGWHFWPSPRVRLDLDDIGEYVASVPNLGAAGVEQAFLERGIAIEAPTVFNYDLLTYHGMAELPQSGRIVPLLQFHKERDFLQVFVLDGNRFDLNALATWVGPSRQYTVAFVPSSSGKFGYVLIYSGGSLAPFFARTPISTV